MIRTGRLNSLSLGIIAVRDQRTSLNVIAMSALCQKRTSIHKVIGSVQCPMIGSVEYPTRYAKAAQRGTNADQILDGYPGPRRGYRLGDDKNALNLTAPCNSRECLKL